MGRILLADDDAAMRTMLSMFLSKQGHIVELSADGEQLVEAIDRLEAAEMAPDLVITDLRMKACTGLDVVHRAREAFPDTPVVLITAFGDARTHARAKELGASAIIDKPFALPDLQATIDSLLPS